MSNGRYKPCGYLEFEKEYSEIFKPAKDREIVKSDSKIVAAPCNREAKLGGNGYHVLIPQLQLEQEPTATITLANKEELLEMTAVLDPTDLLAWDLETRGLYCNYHRDWQDQEESGQDIVMIGLHQTELGSVAIDLRGSYEQCLYDLCYELIRTQQPLCAYNHYFDLRTLAGKVFGGLDNMDWTKLNNRADGLWLYKTLGTEGYLDQQHGLKTAQQKILGWSERGDAELGEWLSAHKFKKSDMHKAPVEMLGHYCALDAQSTFTICKYLTEISNMWPALALMNEAYLSEVRMLVVNYFSGIGIDVAALKDFIASLDPKLHELEKQFVSHPKVAPYIATKEEAFEAEAERNKPNEYLKRTVPKEPEKYSKAGSVSKRWIMWEQKMLALAPPTPNKAYAKWLANKKQRAIDKEQHGISYDIFNMGSTSQLCDLMYNYLEFPVLSRTKPKKGEPKGIAGNPSAGKEAYPGWGDLGVILQEYSMLSTERSQAVSWLESTDPETGLMYPAFKLPGTGTTRPSGDGGCNVLNPLKRPEFMNCIREPDKDNWVWVDADFVSQESVIMAYISQDKGYLTIYGPNAKPNDIYIYLMSKIPGMKELTQECGYDPDNPTPEAIKLVKKKYKPQRNAAKGAVLSLSYGSGCDKLHQKLFFDGVKIDGKPLSIDQVRVIYDLYKLTFKGLKEYDKWCELCWTKTGGWVLNPLGMPIASCADKVYKLGNACCQSTGHCITMLWLMYIEKYMDASGVPWLPIIWDFYDETLFKVQVCDGRTKEETIAIAHKAMKEALVTVNKLLCTTGTEIPMKISPDSGYNLTKFKCEE